MLRMLLSALLACAIVLSLHTAAAGADEPDYQPGTGIEINPVDPGEPSDWDNGGVTDDSGDTGDTGDYSDDAGNTGPNVPLPPTCPPGNPQGCAGGPAPGDPPEQPAPEEPPTPVLINPGEVAQEAIDTLPLATPKIRMAPAGSDDAPSLVNLPTWLWIDSGGWDSLSKSVSAGSTTVSVAAKPVSVAWDMGAGTVSCDGPGTPWTGGDQKESPTGCDFTYTQTSRDQPEGEYPVSVTIQYRATWTCEGFCMAESGTLGVVAGPSATTSAEVGERQSVVIQ